MISNNSSAANSVLRVHFNSPFRLAERCKVVKFDLGALYRKRLRVVRRDRHEPYDKGCRISDVGFQESLLRPAGWEAGAKLPALSLFAHTLVRGRRLADVPLRHLAFQFQSLRVADRKAQRRVTR